MSTARAIMSDDVRRALLNYTANAVVLAINAASAATVKTTNAAWYTVNGVFKTKAPLAAQSIAVTHGYLGAPAVAGGLNGAAVAYAQPANTRVVYLVCADAAGNIAIVQGTYAGQPIVYPADLSRVNVGDGAIPTEPPGFTCIAAFRVTTGATTFTPGTTALDAANVTVEYFDISILPAVL